ncbi:hypothetical protein [Micrococcus luteus]|uniref:hypothetical protein n=1 Tax=Micrococcus luteus TaxID=1270 RepID=UPI0010095DBB|nr:hypothetical protein [Micrococcus luteus]QAV29794.1 hypothetical protein MT1254_11120 [Micrococcus luteus]
MSPEYIALLITSLSPIVLALMAGIGWVVRHRIETATAPGAEPPTTQTPAALPRDLYDDCRQDLETTRAELTSERARRIHLEGILARLDITPTTPTED